MYDWVHAGRIDVATSVLRTPARAGLAHYSEPIITEYTVVMVPRGRVFPLRVIGDLAGKRIGGQLGFKYPPLEGTGIELVREGSYEINIRKFAEGAIDGALIGSVTGPYLIRQLGLTDNIEFLPAALGAVDLGVALSRKTFTDRDLAAFNSATAALRESGAWMQILEQNGVARFVRSWPILAN